MSRNNCREIPSNAASSSRKLSRSMKSETQFKLLILAVHHGLSRSALLFPSGLPDTDPKIFLTNPPTFEASGCRYSNEKKNALAVEQVCMQGSIFRSRSQPYIHGFQLGLLEQDSLLLACNGAQCLHALFFSQLNVCIAHLAIRSQSTIVRVQWIPRLVVLQWRVNLTAKRKRGSSTGH
jgi:hypothetical protein